MIILDECDPVGAYTALHIGKSGIYPRMRRDHLYILAELNLRILPFKVEKYRTRNCEDEEQEQYVDQF